jgi:phosphoribosylaminoimidazolecarboxamide formyltransferase/IMP cyclohydrolase
MPIALLSVSDKRGLVDFGQVLRAAGWTLLASGGTAKALQAAGIVVTELAAWTGAPEMLGGRVKTLHPVVHAGILARANAADQAELERHGIKAIDLVVCNLYPFQETVAQATVSLAEAIEQIDIGGVTLLRAAAKNFERVTVICDPADYEVIAAELRNHASISASRRASLAGKAFAHTAQYDAAIVTYLNGQLAADGLPPTLNLALVQSQPMRYGENPHQAAALYAPTAGSGPLGGHLLQGKALSYNNMLDLDAAWQAARAFAEPTVVIVKHLSPCGLASATDLATALPAALASDPVSAFGGVIAVNRPVDPALVEALGELFVEAIAAPAFTPAAQELLASRKNCRLLEISQPVADSLELRAIAGGVLVQQRDFGDPADTTWQVVSDRQPREAELASLKFAWRACQHVKSNAIVLVAGTATVGIGGGLPSRVDSVKLAASKAGEKARGAVLASDAFFPFPDGLEVAGQAGVTAVVQPGGSVRDQAVIETANQLGLAMIFTGVRHFRH